jgi:hypothetical protein
MVSAAASGLAAGLVLGIHTYVAMFGITLCAVMLALAGLERLGRRERWALIAFMATVTAMASAVLPDGEPVARLVVLLALLLGAAAALGVRNTSWRATLAFACGAAVTAAPQLFRIAAAVIHGNEFLQLRQQATFDLSLPPLGVLLYFAPILFVAACSVIWPPPPRGWFAGSARRLMRTTLIGGLLLSFNQYWGLNQEPYRFVPYTMLFLSVAASPWLIVRPTNGSARRAWLLAGALLAITLPSTVKFVHDQNGQTVAIARPGRLVYAEIAAWAPPDGLILVDSCMSPPIFKLATGAPIAGYNAGIALPDHVDAIRAALTEQQAGKPPSLSVLRQAGIGLVVKEAECERSGPIAAYTTELGPPIATVHTDRVVVEMREQEHLVSESAPRSYLLFRVA